jgi:hypothetical protein
MNSFSTGLWGGFDKVLVRFDEGRRAVGELVKLLQERHGLDSEYASGVQKVLGKKGFTQTDGYVFLLLFFLCIFNCALLCLTRGLCFSFI